MNWDELADDISEAREGDRGGLGDPRRSGSRVGENRGSYTVRVGLALGESNSIFTTRFHDDGAESMHLLPRFSRETELKPRIQS